MDDRSGLKVLLKILSVLPRGWILELADDISDQIEDVSYGLIRDILLDLIDSVKGD